MKSSVVTIKHFTSNLSLLNDKENLRICWKVMEDLSSYMFCLGNGRHDVFQGYKTRISDLSMHFQQLIRDEKRSESLNESSQWYWDNVYNDVVRVCYILQQQLDLRNFKSDRPICNFKIDKIHLQHWLDNDVFGNP
jgi:hypothetical protein